MERPTIWTIGHSNHEPDHFLAMLRSFCIQAVADVRRFAASRRQPQFSALQLSSGLAEAGIEYHHYPELGGRRHSEAADSPNMAWRVAAFRAYADYMQSDEFHTALSALQKLAAGRATVMMCAEAVPWRCHRRLIADSLVAQNWIVVDIYSPGRSREHTLTDFARIDGGRVTYPG